MNSSSTCINLKVCPVGVNSGIFFGSRETWNTARLKLVLNWPRHWTILHHAVSFKYCLATIPVEDPCHCQYWLVQPGIHLLAVTKAPDACQWRLLNITAKHPCSLLIIEWDRQHEGEGTCAAESIISLHPSFTDITGI